jgi:inorganic pyrophosphatase
LSQAKDLADIDGQTIDELEEFFVQYNKLERGKYKFWDAAMPPKRPV